MVGRRHSIRLKGYDYSQAGAYFVTLCTHHRTCLFGEIVDREMHLNDTGHMVKAVWDQLAHRFDNVELDERVIMPNHIHGVIFIVGAPLVGALKGAGTRIRAGTRPAPTATSSLGDIVGAFKSIATHEYIGGVKQHGWPRFSGKLWQRNYYERVVRDDAELNAVRAYIAENPRRWDMDRENPDGANYRKQSGV